MFISLSCSFSIISLNVFSSICLKKYCFSVDFLFSRILFSFFLNAFILLLSIVSGMKYIIVISDIAASRSDSNKMMYLYFFIVNKFEYFFSLFSISFSFSFIWLYVSWVCSILLLLMWFISSLYLLFKYCMSSLNSLEFMLFFIYFSSSFSFSLMLYITDFAFSEISFVFTL